jgi:hypothetical protein
MPRAEIVAQVLILTMLNNRIHNAATQEAEQLMLVPAGGLILAVEPARVAGVVMNPGNGTRVIRTVRSPAEILANGRIASAMWKRC